jgi:excisionase family DNA binding protein
VNSTYYTTAQLAALLGISQRRVQALIRSRKIPHQKISATFLISSDQLAGLRDRLPGRPGWRNQAGRPRKPKAKQ